MLLDKSNWVFFGGDWVMILMLEFEPCLSNLESDFLMSFEIFLLL